MVIRPDKSIGLQIILCGLLLAIQLVGGKHYDSSVYEDQQYDTKLFKFEQILKLTSNYVNSAKAAYDKIELE